MPRILIATNQPNQYPQGTLAKCGDSLRELARRVTQIPVIWGSHNGRQTGLATLLEYQDRGGIGELYAVVSDKIPTGWGASLQYSGKVIGNTIRVMQDRGLHLAIVPNPRDQRTIYADSDMAYQIFRDSVEGENTPVIDSTPAGPVTVETPVPEQPATPPASAEPSTGTEIEIPEGVLESLFSNAAFIEKIAAGIAKHLTPEPQPQPEVPEQPATPTPKITYRVPAPATPPVPKPTRPAQHKPKALN